MFALLTLRILQVETLQNAVADASDGDHCIKATITAELDNFAEQEQDHPPQSIKLNAIVKDGVDFADLPGALHCAVPVPPVCSCSSHSPQCSPHRALALTVPSPCSCSPHFVLTLLTMLSPCSCSAHCMLALLTACLLSSLCPCSAHCMLALLTVPLLCSLHVCSAHCALALLTACLLCSLHACSAHCMLALLTVPLLSSLCPCSPHCMLALLTVRILQVRCQRVQRLSYGSRCSRRRTCQLRSK